MGFEFVPRGTFGAKPGLSEGEVALLAGGVLTFRRDDLALVGIGDRVAVLVDRGTLRIAFRAPTEDEAADASQFYREKDSESGRRKLLVNRALKELGLNARDLAGRYQLMTKDRLLIWTPTDASSADKAIKPDPAERVARMKEIAAERGARS